jgi:aspartate/methionine/tyrosine aminotransferase
MRSLRPFALEEYFSRWEFTARYNVGGSDMQSMPLAELLSLASDEQREAWDRLSLGYTETWGAPLLRETIAARYEGLGPENVLCFAGAEEGIFCAMHALLAPGDHAVVCVPNYQSSESLPLSICEVSGLPLRSENHWQPDLDELKALLRPNTRVVSVNFPNNPTGALLSRACFEELVAICRERGIHLFSDEVYRGLEHDPGRRLPQAAACYERGVSLNVMSKAYGLAGLRIGWIASQDTALLQSMERFKHYLSICNSAPSEYLACIALTASETILERNRGLLAANLELLQAFMARHAEQFDWYTPEAGCIAFPRHLGAEGADAMCDQLVRQCGVLLIPGSKFQSRVGAVDPNRFRVGFGRGFFPEALEVWERSLT